ncbi:MAG: molybdopterin-dependent oxidoreductase [Gammaproteobacteria bacterium]
MTHGSAPDRTRIPGYCALCWSSCGCVSVVEDGRLVAVEADPSHPTGAALCSKGRAAPEYVYSDARVLHPMKRTRPKGDPDPGWERISWDEALDLTAAGLRRVIERAGPRALAVSITTAAGTAMQDAYPFIERLRHAIGTPNAAISMELCGWAKLFVHAYTFGTPQPAPEVEHSDCIVLWGHNPAHTWLALGTRVNAAVRRGARLVVIDPVRVGLAAKADHWLRVRPGSDGALALAMAHVLIEEALFDADFVRTWTNGPFLVRDDDGRCLSGADIAVDGDPAKRVGWDERGQCPVLYDPASGRWEGSHAHLALRGGYRVRGARGDIACRPAFDHYAALCARHAPERAATLTWIDAAQIRAAARTIGASDAVSLATWAGLEMHSNTTQTARAINCLYALTGCFDAPGGNVVFDKPGVADVTGAGLLPADLRADTLGIAERPLGPEAAFGWVNTDALYRAVLEREPYGVDALLGFGLNMLVSHADGERGARALAALEFMAQADLFMTPTARHADVFLPVCTPWERTALKCDFVVDQRASATVQWRPAVIAPRGESRPDFWIAAELARRLGLGEHLWHGDEEAAWSSVLAPTGVTLDALRAAPGGRLTLPLTTRYRKYAEPGSGFATPSRRVEIFAETFQAHGHAPLPEFVEPALGPADAALAARYPLVLTDTKSPHFIHSQYRHVAALRRHERDPLVHVHPDTARARAIAEGMPVVLSTPHGSVQLRAKLNANLDPRVVRASYGWWQGCAPLGLADAPAAGTGGANLNYAIGNAAADPIGGCVPHKSYVCELRPVMESPP